MWGLSWVEEYNSREKALTVLLAHKLVGPYFGPMYQITNKKGGSPNKYGFNDIDYSSIGVHIVELISTLKIKGEDIVELIIWHHVSTLHGYNIPIEHDIQYFERVGSSQNYIGHLDT